MNYFLTQPRPKNHRAFMSFYDAYAPKLWGLILSANLPASRSETILINTLLKAWQHPDRQTILEKRAFTWLVGLACAEGMPANTLSPCLNRRDVRD